MSVTAHLTEMYFARHKLPGLNFRWLVVGCYFPDGWGLSKLLLLTTGDPSYHRDILFGWTHSLPVCGAIAGGIGAVFGRRAGWSFAIAAWLHTIMDLGDPIGVKMFYPFLDTKFSLGLWPWTDGDIGADLANSSRRRRGAGAERRTCRAGGHWQSASARTTNPMRIPPSSGACAPGGGNGGGRGAGIPVLSMAIRRHYRKCFDAAFTSKNLENVYYKIDIYQ